MKISFGAFFIFLATLLSVCAGGGKANLVNDYQIESKHEIHQKCINYFAYGIQTICIDRANNVWYVDPYKKYKISKAGVLNGEENISLKSYDLETGGYSVSVRMQWVRDEKTIVKYHCSFEYSSPTRECTEDVRKTVYEPIEGIKLQN